MSNSRYFFNVEYLALTGLSAPRVPTRTWPIVNVIFISRCIFLLAERSFCLGMLASLHYESAKSCDVCLVELVVWHAPDIPKQSNTRYLLFLYELIQHSLDHGTILPHPTICTYESF